MLEGKAESMARAAIFQVRMAGGLSLVLIGLIVLVLPIGFVIWAHHMFAIGINANAIPLALLILSVPALIWVLGSVSIIGFGVKLLRPKGAGSNGRPPTPPEP